VVDNTQVADFGGFGSLSISPDGKKVAMTGIERKGLGSTSLYKAPSSTTTTTQATVLSGTTVRPWQNNRTNERNDLVSLAFSPDGRSIAYNLWTIRNTGFLVEEIRSVPASGGTPTVIVPEGSGSSILHQDLAWAPQLGAGLAVRRPEGAGVVVPVDVAPNTRLALPGAGYVIINEQKLPAPGSTARTQVNGLHVFVTKTNTFGIPVGTQIIVAHADSTAVRF
jgi:Tol biopolymer transport system component